MRAIIAGSRTATREDVSAAMDACPFAGEIHTVLCGMAMGADTYGRDWARENGIQVKLYPANWAELGKSAGVVRNTTMARNADALVAVWDGQSRGTLDMIKKAIKRDLKVFVYYLKSGSWTMGPWILNSAAPATGPDLLSAHRR